MGRGGRLGGRIRCSWRRIGGLYAVARELRADHGVGESRKRPVRVRGVVFSLPVARFFGAAAAGSGAGAAAHDGGSAAS